MKRTISATGFQRKPYDKPQFRVVEIDKADIIATSDGYGDPTVTTDDM